MMSVEHPMAIAKKSAPKKTKAAAEVAPKKKVAKPEKAAPATKSKAAPPVKTVKEPAPAAKSKKSVGKKAEAAVEVMPAAPIAPPPASLPGLAPLAASILSAIQDGRAVEFIFKDADTNAPRTFEPRQLSFDALTKAWYVFGWDRRYNAERHHCVDLLAEVNAVDGVGRSAQGPFPEGTPGNQIGGWLGGDAIAVKATLQKQWVFAVKQAPPAFPKFKLTDKEDGRAEVTFTATDLRAIARWIMQFGDGITVQEPQRLSDRLRQVASVWAGKDMAKPSAPAPAPVERSASAPRHHEPREERPARAHQEAKAESRSSSKVEVRVERL
jgi:predicted DNA-binding transcriptional regulator YafY